MNLSFTSLPDLPQIDTLKQVASNIWHNDDVQALWVGGSLAHGRADLYSDIDLRVAVSSEKLKDWQRLDIKTLFAGRCVAHKHQPFGEGGFLHHLLLTTGDLYDLWIQNAEGISTDESCLVLGCRDPQLTPILEASTSSSVAPQETSPDPKIIQQAIVDFWINSHKHCKVLHRGLDTLVLTGIHAERSLLMRLWAVVASGIDAGAQRPSIHSLTAQTRIIMTSKGAKALEILGTPVRTRSELFRMIERLRDEVSVVGHQLAEQLSFTYPADLESTVRDQWRHFLLSHE